MSTNEIKAFLALKGLTVTEVADAIEEDRTCVAKVISYARATAHIRKKLKRKYRITFDKKVNGRRAA